VVSRQADKHVYIPVVLAPVCQEPGIAAAATETLDIGRIYADANGTMGRQTIKACPGVAGCCCMQQCGPAADAALGRAIGKRLLWAYGSNACSQVPQLGGLAAIT